MRFPPFFARIARARSPGLPRPCASAHGPPRVATRGPWPRLLMPWPLCACRSGGTQSARVSSDCTYVTLRLKSLGPRSSLRRFGGPKARRKGVWATPIPQAFRTRSSWGWSHRGHRDERGDVGTRPRPSQDRGVTWRSSACYKTMIRPITQALRGRVRKMGWGALAALKPARPDPSAGDRARSKGNASRPPQDHQSSASRPYGGLGARLWSSGSRHPKTLIGTLKCPSDGRSARPPEDAPR